MLNALVLIMPCNGLFPALIGHQRLEPYNQCASGADPLLSRVLQLALWLHAQEPLRRGDPTPPPRKEQNMKPRKLHVALAALALGAQLGSPASASVFLPDVQSLATLVEAGKVQEAKCLIEENPQLLQICGGLGEALQAFSARPDSRSLARIGDRIGMEFVVMAKAERPGNGDGGASGKGNNNGNHNGWDRGKGHDGSHGNHHGHGGHIY
jgi:hypothetical protein